MVSSGMQRGHHHSRDARNDTPNPSGRRCALARDRLALAAMSAARSDQIGSIARRPPAAALPRASVSVPVLSRRRVWFLSAASSCSHPARTPVACVVELQAPGCAQDLAGACPTARNMRRSSQFIAPSGLHILKRHNEGETSIHAKQRMRSALRVASRRRESGDKYGLNISQGSENS